MGAEGKGLYEYLLTREVPEDTEIKSYTFPNTHPAGGSHRVVPPLPISKGIYKEYAHAAIAKDQDLRLRIEGDSLFLDPVI